MTTDNLIVRDGDTVTLTHPATGDRIGPRTVTAIRQAGGAISLFVERVGDVAVSGWAVPRSTDQGRYLGTLISAGWVVDSVTRPSDSDTPT